MPRAHGRPRSWCCAKVLSCLDKEDVAVRRAHVPGVGTVGGSLKSLTACGCGCHPGHRRPVHRGPVLRGTCPTSYS
eukprot:2825785-Prymnesium_polylepis.1